MCDEGKQNCGNQSGKQPCSPRQITIVVTVEGCTCAQQPQVKKNGEDVYTKPAAIR